MRASWMVGITVLGWLLVGCSQPPSSAAEIPLVERLEILSGSERHTSRSGNSSLARYNVKGRGVDSTKQAILRELRAFGFEWVQYDARSSDRIVLIPTNSERGGGPTMITIGSGFVTGNDGEIVEPDAEGSNVFFYYTR